MSEPTLSQYYSESLNLTEQQPLTPYIEITVCGVTITNFTVDGENTSFDGKLTDTFMEFVYHRKAVAAENESGNKFELTLFDETAIEVEALLCQALQEVQGATGTGVDGEGGGNTNAADAAGIQTMSYEAVMKRDYGKYKKGQKVTVTRTPDGKWLINGETKVKDSNNSLWGKYFDLKTQKYNNKVTYSKSQAEAFVNSQGYKSETGYLVWANKYTQKVYVFKGSKGNWVLQGTYKASTGSFAYSQGSDPGVYVNSNSKIYDKSPVKTNDRGATMYYCMSYSSPGGNALHAGGNGKPKTHGCVAIDSKGVKYVYNNCPINTRVVVY